MRRKKLFLGLLVLLGVLAAAALALWRSEGFWHAGGRVLLSWLEGRLPGQIRVEKWEGHPLTGLVLRGVTVMSQAGEVLAAPQVKVRLSLWSVVTLQPVIGYLELVEPRITLRTGDMGLFPLNSQPQERGETRLACKSLTLSEVVVKKGQLFLHRGGEVRQFRDLEAQLTLTLLYPGQPRQMLLLRRARLEAASPWGPFRLTCRLSYGHRSLNLLALALKSRERTWLTLSGDLNFGEKDTGVQLQGEVGPLSGKDLHETTNFWPPDLELEGRFQIAGTLSELKAKLEGRVAEGSFTLEGHLQRQGAAWEAQGDLSLGNLKPALVASFSRWWAKQLDGLEPFTLQGRVQVRGAAWSWEQFQGRFTGGPRRWGLRHLEHLELTLAGTPRSQQLTVSLQGNFGRAAVNFKGLLFPGPQGEVEVRGEGLRPSLLGLPGPPEDLFTGTFQGTFRLPRWTTPTEAAVAGDLKGHGRWRGTPLSEVRARLSWERHKLTISRAELTWGNLRAAVQGTVTPERLELRGEGQLLPGAGGPFPAALKGQLHWQGACSGTPSAPHLTFKAQGRHLTWSGLGLETLNLLACLEGWDLRGGHLQLKGQGWRTPMGNFSQASFNCQGTGGNWRLGLKGASPQGPRVEMAGTANSLTRPLEVGLEKFWYQRNQVTVESARPVRLRLFPGVEVEPAAFRINQGLVQLEAKIREDRVSGHLTAEKVPAGVLTLRGWPLEGELKAQVSLGGEARRPVLKGEITLSPGRLGDFPFHSLTGAFAYQERQLTVSGQMEQRPGGPRLSLNGRLPVQFSLSPFEWTLGQEDLQLRLEGDRADLALLAALTPEVAAASGPLNLKVEWQGPAARPQVNGEVRWGEGSLKFRQAGLPYRLRPGVIRLQGNTLSIPQIVLDSRGTAIITGEVRLSGFHLDKVNLTAELENFRALSRAGSEARGGGSLFLKGDSQELALTGRLKVTQANFRSIFFATGLHEDIVLVHSPGPAPPPGEPGADLVSGLANRLRMDLILESSGGVWVRDPQFRVELAGTLRALKKPGESALVAGQLRALQGTIDIQGRAFKIVEGTLNFPEVLRLPITLSGRAVYEMPDVTLLLTLSGPATSPVLQYSSIPPLPPSDVLAYLLFGRPTRTLNREEYQVVSPEALGALGGLAAKKLQDFLGKGFPLLGDITFKGDTERVGLSKPLTKDLSISLERKINPLSRDDENQIRLEYRINRHLGVESQMGKRNSGADVIFNFDF